MKISKAFTLAEVLITFAIIGVVTAISISSVISNSQQQEFKTGLRKAVSVLNSAITMNMAIDGESPYDNKDLFNYLQRHMGVLKSTLSMPYYTYFKHNNGGYVNEGRSNAAFYTTDGMRFEFKNGSDRSANHASDGSRLHESNLTFTCTLTHPSSFADACGGCGSYGLNHNPNGTTKAPCLILVDVNGDKKPTPGNVNCRDTNCAKTSNLYKLPLPSEKKVTDIFSILITDEKAVPYGITAQKAMYQAQK